MGRNGFVAKGDKVKSGLKFIFGEMFWTNFRCCLYTIENMPKMGKGLLPIFSTFNRRFLEEKVLIIEVFCFPCLKNLSTTEMAHPCELLKIIILRHIIYNMESKIFLSNGTFFLPDVCQLRSPQHRQLFTFVNVNFFHQIVANLP